jgi:hypothetical protein
LIESPRVFERYRLEGSVDDQTLVHLSIALCAIADGLYIVELADAVKQRAAESFPTVVGTHEVIRLSSAALWAEQEGRRIRFLKDRIGATVPRKKLAGGDHTNQEERTNQQLFFVHRIFPLLPARLTSARSARPSIVSLYNSIACKLAARMRKLQQTLDERSSSRM